MGGAGPYVKFTPTLSLRKISGGQCMPFTVEQVYERAKPYLLTCKEQLLSLHPDYQEGEPPTSPAAAADSPSPSPPPLLLFSVSNPDRYSTTAGRRRHFMLPLDVQSFACNPSMWDRVFTALHAKRPDRLSSDLFLDEAPPLQNIFYLLQTILDGMLCIVREDDIDDYGEQITTRVLPRRAWIEENSDVVKEILALPSTEALEEDAEKHGILYKWEGCNYERYTEESEDLDFTACDRECGYCGKCDY